MNSFVVFTSIDNNHLGGQQVTWVLMNSCVSEREKGIYQQALDHFLESC